MNDSSRNLMSASMVDEGRAGTGWSRALLATVAALLWVIACYHQTAISMVGIWSHSATFTHGFIVPPIALWLIWQQRQQVLQLAPRPNLWLCLPLAAAGFVWLLGALADVNVLTQFAFMATVVMVVPAILGLHVARQIAFPLGFLFFAVPFGDFVVPQMMEWTANFTVWALRLTGIPVYREGLQFVVPSGTWSVVEACSGARYLIASLTVGTLFAYLNYRSLQKRLLFAAAAIVVPVIANWLRAYFIVLLGYLSDNRLAAGVDHLVYGWVFFGIVILGMFWVGARWREDDSLPSAPLLPTVATLPAPRPYLKMAVLLVLLTGAWPVAQWQLLRAQGERPPITTLATLNIPASWMDTGQGSLGGWHPRFEQANATQQGSLQQGGQAVGYFVAYYRHQDHQRELVNSANMLVNSEDPSWIKLAVGKRDTQIGGTTIPVRTTVLRGIDNTRLLVWQWYWVNGHLTASDAQAKAYTAMSRLRGQGDDSAVIVLYTIIDRDNDAEAALATFSRDVAPAIEASLQKTGGGQ